MISFFFIIYLHLQYKPKTNEKNDHPKNKKINDKINARFPILSGNFDNRCKKENGITEYNIIVRIITISGDFL